MPIFCVKSVKIYTGQKKFTWVYSWRSWQIWGMLVTYFKKYFPNFPTFNPKKSPIEYWLNSEVISSTAWSMSLVLPYGRSDCLTISLRQNPLIPYWLSYSLSVYLYGPSSPNFHMLSKKQTSNSKNLQILTNRNLTFVPLLNKHQKNLTGVVVFPHFFLFHRYCHLSFSSP